jgi:hypothetical protein
LPVQVESNTLAVAEPSTKSPSNQLGPSLHGELAPEIPELIASAGDSEPAIETKPVVNSMPTEVAELNPLKTGLWLILGLSTVGLGAASYALLRNLRSSLRARRRTFVLVS